MEIEGEDGSKILIKLGSPKELGRGLGSTTDDRTVSRRQVSFRLHSSLPNDESNVSFEVIGKNPVWVYNSSNGQIRVYRRYEKGELGIGDMFCLSSKNPIWFTLKKLESEEGDSTGVDTMTRLDNELAESLNSSGLTETEELELEDVDFSNIDPVKEFGFLVIGKEFEAYNSKKIRDLKSLDWFLTEPGLESEDDDDDDDEDDRKGKKIAGNKRKKPKGNKDEDDEWVGESDEDKKLITKSTRTQKPKYSTRSKASDKTLDANIRKKPRIARKVIEEDEEQEVESDIDDDEETLGGFIVEDEEAEQEVESDLDDDEEEEFEDDEDDE